MATFSPEQIRAFLDRIRFPIESDHLPVPSGELLNDLHWAHLQAVPFENLDIVRLGREILLDPTALYGKIVGDRRGGYCFEVNGLLGVMLEDLGFDVRRVMVQFIREEGEVGQAFDHLALIASVPGEEERWLVDVGSGRQGFPRPLRLRPDVEQRQAEVDTTYRLTRTGPEGRWELATRGGGAEWAPWYVFDETARQLGDFAGRNAFFQTDEASPFRNGPMATLARAGGRVTLTADRLIETIGGIRSERAVTPAEADALLAAEFGIKLTGDPRGGAFSGRSR